MLFMGDFVDSGISLAKVGPTFTKYELNPLAILVLSVTHDPFILNLEEQERDLFLLITSLMRFHDFFKLPLYV